MIWLNPWAWLGLIGIALPVLIHLLGRGHARVHKFPTLRFLDASRLMPTKRTRVHDAALLAVRVGILVAAVAALAQPLWLTAGRKRRFDRGLARAIIVDTSASMRPNLDSARAAAKTLARDAQASIVIESDDPAHSLGGAAAWVARQGRRGEVAIVSDFQRGQVLAGDLASVPAAIGLMMHRVGHADAVSPSGVVEWASSPATATIDSTLVTLAADSERVMLDAARTAAATAAVPAPIDSARAIAIVFPDAPQRAALIPSLKPISAIWMSDLLERFANDSIPVERAGIATIDGRERLVLFASSTPGSLVSARLIAAANQARSTTIPAREREPASLDDATLRGWERPSADSPSQARPTDANAPSDARWLWAIALMLLLAELRLRREPLSSADAVEAPARAA